MNGARVVETSGPRGQKAREGGTDPKKRVGGRAKNKERSLARYVHPGLSSTSMKLLLGDELTRRPPFQLRRRRRLEKKEFIYETDF